MCWSYENGEWTSPYHDPRQKEFQKSEKEATWSAYFDYWLTYYIYELVYLSFPRSLWSRLGARTVPYSAFYTTKSSKRRSSRLNCTTKCSNSKPSIVTASVIAIGATAASIVQQLVLEMIGEVKFLW